MQELRGQDERKTTKQKGDAAEDRALRHLQAQGLQLVQRNYRTPGRGGGEIDLIVCDRDGTLVFVEVRHRGQDDPAGALASITSAKRKRIVFAARHYLLNLCREPACRFDVVTLDGEALQWYPAAFDAS